ncbi:MAG: ATP-binding cassette domain-containing protein [Blautia wexlerae]
MKKSTHGRIPSFCGASTPLEKGETIAIIGSSGSGKTCCAYQFLTASRRGQIGKRRDALRQRTNTQKSEIRRKRLHSASCFKFQSVPQYTTRRRTSTPSCWPNSRTTRPAKADPRTDRPRMRAITQVG